MDYSSSSDEEDAVAKEREGNGGRRSDLSRSVDSDSTDSSQADSCGHTQLSRDGRTEGEVGTACT